ncbi:MAG: phosphatidylglycerol lysyltransferase domain-containing protein [Rhodobacteraceae bacterium]|nr:phosphatidylglycerol lysyltransferase domain-containing protein [Paracoccaceae bacterium]
MFRHLPFADPRARRAARRPDRTPRAAAVRIALRQLPAPLIALGLAVVLMTGPGGLSPATGWTAIGAGLDAVPPAIWGLALVLAAISHLAAAHYDLAARALAQPGSAVARLSRGTVRRGGLVASVLAQAAGFGLLTGTLARLRMLPGLSLTDALRQSVTVAALFLAGWATLALGALAVLPLPPGAATGPGSLAATAQALAPWALVPAALGAAALCLLRPALPLPRGRRLRPPSLRVAGGVLAITALDLGAAAASLWLLIPTGTVDPATFALAFLLAYGAGILSGIPGGAAAFDVTLVALLSGNAPPDPGLIAALLGWRLIYHGLPGALCLLPLARGPGTTAAPATGLSPLAPPAPGSAPDRALHTAPRAEAGLARQGGLLALSDPASTLPQALARTTPNCLVQIGDALSGPEDAVPARLSRAARDAGLVPVLYKVGDATARAARLHGWTAQPLALEAFLDPRSFDPGAQGLGQLRRKLRQADKAGVTVALADPDALPLADLSALAAAWAAHHGGGERGFSMGRYDPAYVARQQVWIARHGDRPVGFVTFHAGAAERTLDLVRIAPGAPDGTAHALVAAAIRGAAADGIPRLSLAGLPHPQLAARLERLGLPAPAAGLAQFKRAFAPDWEVLWLAAPGWPALVLAAAEIARAVHRPDRLPAPLPALLPAPPPPVVSDANPMAIPIDRPGTAAPDTSRAA